MQLTELKVKRKSLAAEARIIRLEENRCKETAKKLRLKQKLEAAQRKNATFDSLYHHRRFHVRPEARAAHIADAFLRGHPYEFVEKKIRYDLFFFDGNTTKKAHDLMWDRVISIVHKFGFGSGKDYQTTRKEVLEWRNKHPYYLDFGNSTSDFRRGTFFNRIGSYC